MFTPLGLRFRKNNGLRIPIVISFVDRNRSAKYMNYNKAVDSAVVHVFAAQLVSVERHQRVSSCPNVGTGAERVAAIMHSREACAL